MKDELFHALANGNRRRIVWMLRQRTMSAGEIADQFDISQPSVSRHLDVLKQAEAVTTQRQGNQVMYSLNLAAVQELILYGAGLLAGEEGEVAGLGRCISAYSDVKKTGMSGGI